MSYLGGIVHGKRTEAGFQNTLVGSEVAMKRKLLRKAFRTNEVKTNAGVTIGKSTSGPFRRSFHMGDVLSRQNQSCGGGNQVNGTHVNRTKLGGSLSQDSCNVTTLGVTPLEVPLEGGNQKYVSDSSMYTRFKHLESVNLNYNDTTFGGSDNHSIYTTLNRVRK
jgi:hypothetical protein